LAWRKVQKDFEKHWAVPTHFRYDDSLSPTTMNTISPTQNKEKSPSAAKVISPDTIMLLSQPHETVPHPNNHTTSDDESIPNHAAAAARVACNRTCQSQNDHRAILRTDVNTSIATKKKKSVVFMGRRSTRNDEYLRFRYKWKQKFSVGSSIEKACIVKEVLHRFVFLQEDGSEVAPEAARKKIHKDFQKNISPHKLGIPQHKNQQQLDRSTTTTKQTLAKAKSSEAKRQSRIRHAKKPSKKRTDNSSASKPSKSEKLVVYWGKPKGISNLAYIAKLKDKKWDYFNAKTKEEAEKIVDSFLETFIFHNFTPEAARKKVSRALKDIIQPVAKEDFRWYSHPDTGKQCAANIPNLPLNMKNTKEQLGASTPSTHSRDAGSAGKAFPSSNSYRSKQYVH
jgi:hypothetical protein